MLRFIFWNVNEKELGDTVALVVLDRKIDVILLSECPNPTAILTSLHRHGIVNFYHHRSPIRSRVEVFSQLPLGRINPLSDYQGLTFREVKPLLGKDFLLVGAHLPSKLNMSDEDQALSCSIFASHIAQVEKRLGHQRTLVVGDLNMNPFERGIVAANGFHAVSDRAIASRDSRKVRGENYNFFYNPMWNHFGDARGGVAGTYFYDKSQLTEYFWHVFDQVLIRPPLARGFDNRSLEIITKIDGTSLLESNGKPDVKSFSDHLPITFNLDLNGEAL